jgi:hypothetical protein
MLSMMAALPLLLALLLPGCRAAGDLPNIIHIMGDDVGWNDLGYHNDLITSPWIDKLALGGVRLTNHHAFKVCAPSRSGFHTGRLPWQMGYYDNSGAATPWETVDSNKLGADPRFKLLPQLLETKGYVSHAIGCAALHSVDCWMCATHSHEWLPDCRLPACMPACCLSSGLSRAASGIWAGRPVRTLRRTEDTRLSSATTTP